jgi:hypothetical protein
MPPHHCHHCDLNLPTNYAVHERQVKELVSRIFGPSVTVTVRYGVEPTAEISLTPVDETDPAARRRLAEFSRQLKEEPLRATVTHLWRLFDARDRQDLEFSPAGTGTGTGTGPAPGSSGTPPPDAGAEAG